jgi:hypothetical protein
MSLVAIPVKQLSHPIPEVKGGIGVLEPKITRSLRACYNLGQFIDRPDCPMTQPNYGPHNPHLIKFFVVNIDEQEIVQWLS